MHKRPESVLVVIYNEHNEVLVLQRDDDASFWQSVTGSMETQEVPIITAEREVKEETGIDIQKAGYRLIDCRQTNQYSIREDWRHRYAPGVTRNFEYVFCVCVDKSVTITLSEHLSYLWLDKSAAIAKVWSQTNKQAIQAFVPNK